MVKHPVISFSKPIRVVNAKCCNDPRNMCPNCAAAVLASQLVTNDPDELDYKALAELLQIDTDPGKDPVGFVQELRSALNQIQDKLNMDQPTDQPMPAPMDDDDDDAAVTGNRRRLLSVVNDNSREVLDLESQPHRRPTTNKRSERDEALDVGVAQTIKDRWGH